MGRALLRAARTFPAVVLTGPRQSGKTTLLRRLLRETHHYLSLEDPDTRLRAEADPRGFLDAHKTPLIIDEIQHMPPLLSYIKTRIDERRRPGQWILTGSQNFSLMQGVSESLAGRAAVLSLPPFSFAERIGRGAESRDPRTFLSKLSLAATVNDKTSLAEILLRGSFPEIATRARVDREFWCGSYVATYMERDVRQLANVGDRNQFERFLRLAAARTGQILNLSDMARDIGVSVPTARRWLSVLEASYQVLLLYPYFGNVGKRLVKSPKIYFCDTALATYLLGIHDRETLLRGPSFGHLFETMVVTDFYKRFLGAGQMPTISYLRTRDGLEIDLIVEEGQRLHLFEIKSTATVTTHHAASLVRAKRDLGARIASTTIVSNARGNFPVVDGVRSYNWKNILGQ